jgi:D-alanyl-D-alanine dipeptidase
LGASNRFLAFLFYFNSFLIFASGPVEGSRQILLSLSEDWDSIRTSLSFFERASEESEWIQIGNSFEGNLGKKGLAWGLGRHNSFLERVMNEPQKMEGDLKAPAGVFDIPEAFGYRNDPQNFLPFFRNYHPVDENSHCVDDSSSQFYNMNIYDIRDVIVDWFSDEVLRRQDSLYKYAFVVDHNNFSSRSFSPAISQRGSCIFIHLWNALGSPTSGCTSMSEENMLKLMSWLRSSENPRLVQLTKSTYQRYRQPWKLP